MMSRITLGLAVALLAACAAVDVRKRIIPHLLIIGLAVTAAVNAASTGGGLAALGWKQALIVLAAGFLLYCGKCVGAGDVKMLATTALWFPERLLLLAFWVSLCGGVLAVGYAVKRRWTGQPADVPYALAIAAGSTICFIGHL